ncbi:hypothetical protein BH11PSE11_BH11PSE11_37670 [soil metagenome]
MKELSIGELMTRTVVCTSPDTDLADVVRIMRDNRYSCMVVARDQIPVGIVTERDMVRILSKVLEQAHAGKVTAGDIMSSPPVVIEESATFFEALAISKAQRIRHLPVVDGAGKLIGLLTQSDLVTAHFKILEMQQKVVENLVTERTRELEDANNELKAMSLEDALLKIGNRRAMEVDLQYTHSIAWRYKRNYTTVIFDVDNFKSYNDHYGHLAGDVALQQVAAYLQCTIRKADRLYRYGGEEILLLLPETAADGAEILARRLVEGLAQLAIPHCKSPLQCVTISGGIGFVQFDDPLKSSWVEVVAQADRGLYVAKHAGRNQIGIAS